MSNAVDNRVVQLEMDNGSFEKNANKSIKTLDKLDAALNLKNGRRSFEEVEQAAAQCDFKPLIEASKTAISYMSDLGVISMSVLTNLTNKAVDAGIRMAKSLSIDQITSGYSKYEQKTSNVQTLINSTGKSIEEINGYLDRLMWFSDETSYGFTDMTQALSTMVSSGGDIDKIVPMIEGMANATAFAGKGAAEFNRVIYNLNQSYSQGFLSYMDWKSVQMAGASSKQLVETLIQAGEEAGTIKKGEVTIDNFTDTLSKKWATREVMEKGFGYFDEMTQKAYEMIGTLDDQGNKIETASQAYDILSTKYDGVSINAAKAAQEAKSFTEAVDSTKDAVSSGWMRTFEIIFGNYEQAKTLWTDVANGLWNIFAGGFEDRNNMLEEVFQTSPVKKYAQSLEDAGAKFDVFKSKLKETYRENGKRMSDQEFETLTAGATTFEELLGQSWVKSSLLEKTIAKLPKELTKTSTAAKKTTGNISDLLKDVNSGKYGYGIEEQQKRLAEAGIDGSEALGDNWLQKLYNANAHGNQEVIDGLNQTLFATEEVTDAVSDQTDVWDELAKKAKEFDNDGYYAKTDGRTIMLDGLKNVLSAVGERLDVVKKAWEKVFPPMTAERLRNIIISFHAFTEKLKMGSKESAALATVFERVFSVLGKVRDVVVAIGKVGAAALKLTGRFGQWFAKLEPVAKVISQIKTFFDGLHSDTLSGFDTVIQKITEFADTLNGLDVEEFANIAKAVKAIYEKTKPYVESIRNIFTSLFDDVKNVFGGENGLKTVSFGAFIGAIIGVIGKLRNLIKKSSIKKISTSVTGVLNSTRMAISSFTQELKSEKLRNIAISIAILAGSLTLLAAIDNSKLATGIIALAAAATILYLIVDKFSKLDALQFTSPTSGGIKGLLGSLLQNAGELKKLSSVGSFVMKIATSILILSLAMKKLSTMGLDGAVIAVGSLYAMTKIIQSFMKSLDGVDVKNAGSLIGISLAIVVLAGSMKLLSGISVGNSIKSLAVIGGLLLELKLFINGVSETNPGNVMGVAVALVLMASAFVILSGAIGLIGLIPTDSVIKAVISIGAFLLMFGIFAKSMNDVNIGGILAASISIGIISAALVAMAAALTIFSFVSDKSGSVLGIVATLASVVILLGILNKYGGGGGKMLAVSAAILVVSIALNSLALALAMFGAIKNPVQAILTMLGAMVVAFGGLGLAAAILSPVIPAMVALAAVLLMVGAAVALAGAGLAILSVSIVGFAAAILGNIGLIITALTVLVTGLGTVFLALGNVIVSVAVQLIPSLVNAGLILINAVISGFASNVGGIITGIALLIVNILQGLAESIGPVVDAGIQLAVALVNGIADGIRDNSEEIFSALRNLLSSLIELIIEGVGQLLGAIPGIGPKISEALDGAKQSVREFLAPETVKQVSDQTANPTANVKKGTAPYAQPEQEFDSPLVSPEARKAYVAQGMEIAAAVNDGITVGAEKGDTSSSIVQSMLGDADATQITELVTTKMTDAASGIDMFSVTSLLTGDFITSLENSDMATQLQTWMTGAMDGADFGSIGGSGADTMAESFSTDLVSGKNTGAAKESATELGNSAKSGLDSIDTESSGANFTQGFINGILSRISGVKVAVHKVGTTATEGLSGSIMEGSPSKITTQSGKYFSEGFIIGINMNALYAVAAAYNMGTDTVDALNEGIQNGEVNRVVPVLDTSDIYNQMSDFDGTYRPVIKPKLDMSGVDPAFRNMTAVATMRGRTSSNDTPSATEQVNAGTSVNFTQNNYSPKALSQVEIYRQTRNQLNTLKGMLKKS